MSSYAQAGRTGPLNLRQVEVFHAIMITGSLSEAGRLLFVSQPAISRGLALMEQRLGFALFERLKGRLHPTAEAKKLFLEVAGINDGIARLNEMARGMANDGSGVLRIVSSPSFEEWLIPRACARLRKSHPGVRISYRPMSMDALLPHILLGHADLALSVVAADHPNLVSRELGRTAMVCALPAGHPMARQTVIAAADIQDDTLIGYGADTPLGDALLPFWRECGRDGVPDIEVRSSQTVCAFVREGAGVGLIDPYGLTPSLLRDIVVRPITPAVQVGVQLTHSRLEPISVLGKAFVQLFRAILAKEFAPLPGGAAARQQPIKL
jgi:DNA-binding transcriptional LysR family regulator